MTFERDLRQAGIRDERVLAAMAEVPRDEFVPEHLRAEASADRPLPIGVGQTISQPFIVAFMSEKLGLRGGEKILEIGTGSGYQAAVLAALGCEVHSLEVIAELGAAAAERLARLGYRVDVRIGDGYFGLPDAAPFDAIIITAASPSIPAALIEQLREGGKLILPLGPYDSQTLTIAAKRGDQVDLENLGSVAFVPMTGEVRKR